MSDIWDEIRNMQNRINRLFENFNDSFFSDNGPERLLDYDKKAVTNYRKPAADLYETKDKIVADIEIPGVEKKDIKVNVSDDAIEISAESKKDFKQEDKKKSMYRIERSYAGFHRYFSLPKNADPEKAEAEYKNGLLRITIPKKRNNTKEKSLDIK